MKLNIQIIVILIFLLIFSAWKRDRVGCKDIEAINYDGKATLKGLCMYKWIIGNPSFESNAGGWPTYSGTGFCPCAGATSVSDGFMPTDGNYFLKCIPSVYYNGGAATKQYILPNKHFKGFYFDYCYIGKGWPTDSVLTAYASVNYIHRPVISTLWYNRITETPKTFGGYPNILIQKINQYVDLPYYESEGEITITTSVSKGTFTFEVDNIRMVQSDQ